MKKNTDRVEKSRDRERSSLGMNQEVQELDNNIELLILQHPQEPDKDLGTAALCVRSLKNAQLKVGLTWRSLSQALNREAKPSEWAVLYLGGAKDSWRAISKEIIFVDKKGNPKPISPPPLKGLVVLDGTWSQVKSLWWKNPWLLKLQRIVLKPKQKSLYGSLRKEPRKECLSTIESVALALQQLSEKEEITQALNKNFQDFLNHYREINKI